MDYSLPKISGYIEDQLDPRDVYIDEILGGDEQPLPAAYRTDGLVFEPQGAWPFCASMAVTKMVEHAVQKQTGVYHDLSQPHLFFNSGGSPVGSSFRGNLETALKKGCIHYAKCPMPADLYELDFVMERAKALTTPFEDTQKIMGYARVNPNVLDLKRAIVNYGLVLVGVAASGGYWKDGAKRPAGKNDNHAAILCGWDEDGSWWLFDSLQPMAGFTGYHRMDRDYDFQSAYVVTELPADWKEKRDVARAIPEGVQARYGKPRSLQAEIDAGYLIKNALERFVDKRIFDHAGPRWLTYVNAAAYGGWTITEGHPIWKWKKVPGDIVKDAEYHFLTGKHLIDFNKSKV